MERPGMGFNPSTVVQERTFVYNTKQQLVSVTHPESGVTTYSYNFDGTVFDKTDAVGQKTQWTYDTLARPTMAQKFRASSGTPEDLCGKVRYFYDSQNLDGTFSGSNLAARLAAVETGCVGERGGLVQELYSYNVAGAVLTKRVRITRGNSTVTKDIGYTFDAEGKLATVQYPDVAKPFTYFYDAMGRPNRLTGVGWDDNSSTWNTIDHVNGVSYGDAGELLGMTYLQSDPIAQQTNRYFVESRNYNSRLQLIRQTTVLNAGATVTDIKYNFSATANDGRIESRENVVSGEAVSYLYDSLNRLIKAEQTAGPPVTPAPNAKLWGYDYVYDGFGNRWDQLIANGKAGLPSSVQFNQSLNRVSAHSYDANGNTTAMTGASGLSYDVDNRLLGVTTQTSTEQYGYLADNKRFWKSATAGESYYLYGVGGQRILTYTATLPGGVLTFGANPKMDVAFGGRVIRVNGAAVVQDRLGSVVTRSIGSGAVDQHRYYPYGEEIETTTGDRNKFGTYHRDQTGLDYADQRYFESSTGRFMTVDPSQPGVVEQPGSWNFYSYALGDPLNQNDPEGLDVKGVDPVPSNSPTCLGRLQKEVHATRDIKGFLDSDVGTLALQTWFEYQGHDGGQRERLIWRSIANVFRNRWKAPESIKVLLGLKRSISDKLDFKHLILRSSSARDSHWTEERGRVFLKEKETAQLKTLLNGSPDAKECGAFISSLQVSIDVYNDRSDDPTGGSLSYISLWYPANPPGFPANPANLSNPFGAYFTPYLGLLIDYGFWGTVRGNDYYLGFWFYKINLTNP